MDIQEIRTNIELLPDVIYELEKDYLEAKAQLSYMNDLTKHLLAKWKIEYADVKSNAERESIAMSKDKYRLHITGIAEQEKVVAGLAAKFHMEERRFESLRSLNKNI